LRQKHVYWHENKEARQAYNRSYYRRKRDEFIQKAKAYYQENKLTIDERKRKRKAENALVRKRRYQRKREEFARQKRHYRLLHLEEIRACERANYRKNKAAVAIIRKNYRKKYPERVKANVRAYRARKKAAPICDLTERQWQEILQAFHFRCAYCHRRVKRLTQDHLTPLSQQGTHTVANVVPACQSCNSSKGAKPPPVPVQPLLLTLAPALVRGSKKLVISAE